MKDKQTTIAKKISIYLISIIAVSFAIAATWKYVDSRNWVEAQGKIIHISLQEEYNRPLSSSSSGKQFTDYKIDLKYEYEYKGVSYTGDSLYPLIPNVFSAKAHAEKIMKTYAENQSVVVYVNPLIADESCLITSKNLTFFKVFVFGLIFGSIIVMGIVGFVYINKHVFS